MKILNVVGARPNLMKIAPIMARMQNSRHFTPILLHTGQHYDDNMSRIFFEQLKISKPDFNLEVGSGTNSWQVSEVIKRFEPILESVNPDAILLVGDVNSTVACALAASYRGVPVIHVEAGLRSFDRSMPEEINRMVTDRLSDLLFVTEKSAVNNLHNEGVQKEKIHFVGNVMVDTLLTFRAVAEENSDILDRVKLDGRDYAVITLHRPSNVDRKEPLRSILASLAELSKEIPVVFPIHPRTEKRITEFGFSDLMRSIAVLPPLPYLDMLKLTSHARLVLTDSGGIQEESTVLGNPCITLRENTERPITVEEGTNTLVSLDTESILREARNILRNGGKKGRRPELWDGLASERIVSVLASWSLREKIQLSV